MRARNLPGRAARRAGRALPPVLRSRLARRAGRLRGDARSSRVSVIVTPSDDDLGPIGQCLESLRAQRHPHLEVVLAPWGRTRRVRERVADLVARDPRFVLLRDADALAGARSRAVAAAKGEFLVFVDPGDDLPASGLGHLVASLVESGSDLATGRVQRPVDPLGPAIPAQPVSRRVRLATSLQDAPEAIDDLTLGARMFRRRFWLAAGLGEDRIAVSGAATALAGHLRASAVDLLPQVTYVASGRRQGAVFGSMPDRASGVAAWQRDVDLQRALLDEEADLKTRDAWLRGTLDHALQPFLDDVERATHDQWELLHGLVRDLADAADDALWSSLGTEARVKLWLARAGRRAELEEYVAARWFENGQSPTEVRHGQVVARLPFLDDDRIGVPVSCYVRGEAETPLRAVLRGIRWSGPTRLDLDLYTWIEHVSGDDELDVEVTLVQEGSGERRVLEVQRRREPEVNLVAAQRHQDHSGGAVTASLDVAALVQRPSPATARWSLEVSVSTRGITRRGPVTSVARGGTAGLLNTGALGARSVGASRVRPAGGPAELFSLVVEPDSRVRLVDPVLSRRRVSGALRSDQPPAAVVLRRGAQEVRTTVTAPGGRFDVEVPPDEGEPGAWSLQALDPEGTALSVGWPSEHDDVVASPGAAVALARTARGECEVIEAAATVVLDQVELVGRELQVSGHWLAGADGPAPVLELRGDRAVRRGVLDVGAGDAELSFRVPLTWDEWGLGETVVPIGHYALALRTGQDARGEGRLVVGPALQARLLTPTLSDDFRCTVLRRPRGVDVQLLRPLADDERGPHAQQQLQIWARSGPGPVDPASVYLQSYDGASATDSQLALHHELRRRHPELVLRWGVADRSSEVPAGAVPVLMHSREWYRVLATAGHVVVNIDLDRWFRPRPGQRILQTFHGYPAKAMGKGMWQGRGFTHRRIEAELDRTARTWHTILTPAPEMDVHYRREYEYDGRILSVGYPRDDALVGPEAPGVRERTRFLLGIRPEQKVVLYAPTFRDDLATRWKSAELIDHLDLESASARLGGEYVLLMRGHRFHGRTPSVSGPGARLLDVSDYPEINDLILAADAAVLDYSSLRFDFALTGRPMLFLVPDLSDYTGGVRGFLYDFADSAPGPLLDSADDVVEQLQDLPALTARWSDEIARFNASYNRLQDGDAARRVVEAFFG